MVLVDRSRRTTTSVHIYVVESTFSENVFPLCGDTGLDFIFMTILRALSSFLAELKSTCSPIFEVYKTVLPPLLLTNYNYNLKGIEGAFTICYPKISCYTYLSAILFWS